VTRESKLALILSFVLILVVGVLVSDHFSQASDMDPDSLDASLHQPLVQLPGAERNRIDEAINRVIPERSQPDPVIIANGSNYAGTNTGSLLDQLSNGINSELTKNIEQLQAPALASPINSNSRSNNSTTSSTLRPLKETTYATYIVEDGDSLYRIAARSLGDGNRWREIQELNIDQVGSNGVINAGMKLKLPSNARVSARKKPSTSSDVKRPERASTKTYVVVAGDTLGEISTRLLGTSKRVDEFVKLNGLDDANDIRVGMKLKVPAQ
jgi:LysM repeat protein